MKPTLSFLLFVAFLLSFLSSPAQSLCNSNGNLVMFANYDGGVLNINCDVNIPNLKIGVCTYEPVTINITGTFASNVTEVRYAGYVSTNNFHCNNSPSTTTITGVPSNITSINFLPPSTLSNPNGSNSIVCAYSCPATSSQGGCNTSDQVVHYFQTTMNAAMRSYNTQYGCWSATPYTISSGGNCCPNVPPPGCNITANAGTDTTICGGNSTQLNGSTIGGSTYSWSPATGLSCTNCPNPIANPAVTTSYVLTVTDSGSCVEMDTVTIQVNSIQVTTSPLNPVCQYQPPITLSGGMPANGAWSGPGVSFGSFYPSQVNPGNHVLTYTYTDSMGCTDSSSQTITVHPSPVVTLAPFPQLCETDPPYLLSGGMPLGGAYSGMGVSTGGYFNPGFTGPGQFVMSYSYTDSNGCNTIAYETITVSAIPNTPSISQVGSDSLYASIPADSFTWYLNGNQLPGNTQGIQTTQNGTYTVVAWVNGCPSYLSTGYPFDYVAVASGLASGWQVFPNPIASGTAGSVVSINGPVDNYEYLLFDLAGKQLAAGRSIGKRTNINLRSLPAGSYLLEIRSDVAVGKWTRQFVRIVVQ